MKKTILKPAFYNPGKSYDDNYENGPPVSKQKLTPPKRKLAKRKKKFLGFDVNIPFGIPPGPLLNSSYMKHAFQWGFDVSTYKTVRADVFPCHPFPNVLFVDTPENLYPDQVLRLTASPTTSRSKEHISITNSFGVPSKKPPTWQEDVKKALTYVGEGQLMILSVMGTVKEHQTQEEFINDFAKVALLAKETGVKVIEANLSCPNIGNEGLVCYNLEVTEKVCVAIRKQIGNIPLVLKVGYYQNEKDLEKLAQIAHKHAQAIAAINTLQVEVVNKNKEQALPGKNRLRSGICGESIKWAGLEMTDKLNQFRKKHKYNYAIVGIGGVMNAKDYKEYRKSGADLVQSATGAMWNPYLAFDIWKKEQRR